jgi:hypothetical protein
MQRVEKNRRYETLEFCNGQPFAWLGWLHLFPNDPAALVSFECEHFMLLFCCNAQPKGCGCHSKEYENMHEIHTKKPLRTKLINQMFTTI